LASGSHIGAMRALPRKRIGESARRAAVYRGDVGYCIVCLLLLTA